MTQRTFTLAEIAERLNDMPTNIERYVWMTKNDDIAKALGLGIKHVGNSRPNFTVPPQQPAEGETDGK